MQVDQSKLLDQIAYKNTADTTKGIANYISSDEDTSNAIGVSGTSKQKADMSIHKAETVDMSGATYLRPRTENDKTAADALSQENSSAMSRYNEIAVISNTTSAEDLKEMQEDGFSMGDTDSRTIVTVTDKIKAALAKAGVDISGYGDTLSKEQLEEITGNTALANQISAALSAQDLPATEANMGDMEDAAEKIGQLSSLSDGQMAYLIKNQMSPTIENIYRAEYVAGESLPNSAAQNADIRGGSQPISDADFSQMKQQIEQVIRDAGLAVSEDTMNGSRFLLQNNLPLTAENLSYLESLKGLSEQLSAGNVAEDMLSPMCDAIAEGGRPMDAMLLQEYSLKGTAEACTQVIGDATDEDVAYVLAQDEDLTVKNLAVAESNRGSGNAAAQMAKQIVSEQGLAFLTARRQLEETRLAMTSEANYALLRRGISVDTKPLIELVDDLKAQEDQYYRALMGNEGIDSEEKISLFKQTDAVVQDLKTAPAYVIKPGDPDTLRSLHQEGLALKDRFEKANESYEMLMTAPRKEMGDQLQSAFRNVDTILDDLNLEKSDANRRAVRILAYNQTELTAENITQVKAKDEEVQRAFSNLTPKVTMEMIRKGINPLDMDMNELNRTAEEIKSELGDEDTERYQKYLWKLEQNKSITKEERSSYIGIYRLIAQVEKVDHAVIGSLLQQGMGITMRSMLTAVRTENRGSIDYAVDDQFQEPKSISKGEKIDSQIMASYYRNCMHDAVEQMTPKAAEKLGSLNYQDMTPEQVKETVRQSGAENQAADAALEQQYLQEQMEEFSNLLTTPKEIYSYLDRANIPNTMNNLQAVQDMLVNRNRMFGTLWNAKGATAKAMESIEAMKDQVLQKFGEAVKSPEAMADAQETLADVAEHVMDTMILENDSATTLDIKALRMMNTQFSICAKQAKEESYMIPIQTSDGVAGVSLKVVRGTKKKGMVDILFRGSMGKVAASFEAKEKGITALIATDSDETKKLMNSNVGMLAEAISDACGERVGLRVAKVNDQSMSLYETGVLNRGTLDPELTSDDGTEASAEDYTIQTTRLYTIAESFIKAVQTLL